MTFELLIMNKKKKLKKLFILCSCATLKHSQTITHELPLDLLHFLYFLLFFISCYFLFCFEILLSQEILDVSVFLRKEEDLFAKLNILFFIFFLHFYLDIKI